MILLNPGPVVLSDRVRRALLRPDICHREPEFSELQQRIRSRLLATYGLDPAEYAAILLTGSGTAAMEAMVSSVVPAAGRLLVIENGVYGERLGKIAAIHGIAHDSLHHHWDAPIDFSGLQARLGQQHYSQVAVVHHETTSGRLNDLEAVAALCREHRAGLLVDAVSSFGAEMLRFKEWGIDGCAATANKCLHGIPGVSFVIVRRSALDPAHSAPRSLYLDLAGYFRQQEAGGTPFTPAVQAFCALDEALLEFFDQGGWTARHVRYRTLASQVRSGLVKLGIEPLLDAPHCSCVLNAYRLPDGLAYSTLHQQLKQAGFVIYAGQGAFAAKMFRVSTMGAVTGADLDRFLRVMAGLVPRLRS